MGFKVGDRVHFLDEEGEGTIVSFVGTKSAMIELDGFEYEYPLNRIIRVNEDNEVYAEIDVKLTDDLPKDTSNIKGVEISTPKTDLFNRVSRNGIPEIDLHIHELYSHPERLSNSEMVELQIHKMEEFLAACSYHSVSECIIIHGVGEGVLRTEVRKVLDSHGNMKYRDADFREYGAGATCVQIKGLFS